MIECAAALTMQLARQIRAITRSGYWLFCTDAEVCLEYAATELLVARELAALQSPAVSVLSRDTRYEREET